MNIYKEREKQNEEKKRKAYMQKKAFLEYLRECENSTILDETEEKGRHIITTCKTSGM